MNRRKEEFALYFEAVLYPTLVIVMLGAMSLGVWVLYPLVPYAVLALITLVLAGLAGLWEWAGLTWLQAGPGLEDRRRLP